MRPKIVWIVGVACIFVIAFALAARRSFVEEPDHNLDYMLIPAVVDAERRTEPLGEDRDVEPLDMSAFQGMPDAYSQLVSKYLKAVYEEIGASPLIRQRFYHQDRSKSLRFQDRFPEDCNPIADGEITVPLMILPRPTVVAKWAATSKARADGWRSSDCVFSNTGSAYGRTVFFEPGVNTREPYVLPPTPMGYFLPSWSCYLPDVIGYHFLAQEKVSVTPIFNGPEGTIGDGLDRLKLDKEGGAKLTGELVTVPAYVKNTKLRWVSRPIGARQDVFLGYALIDGNGAERAKWFQDFGEGPLSQFIRPLTCNNHQPKIKQHDLLLLPTPLSWAPNRQADLRVENASEEWCLDDWFPAQAEACWVIRESADSKPLQESFELMAATEPSSLPVFFVAVFAETEPAQLVKELAALYNVSPDNVLQSPEAMQRLSVMYKEIQDYSFEPE